MSGPPWQEQDQSGSVQEAGFDSRGVVTSFRGSEFSIPRGIQVDWMSTHQETLGVPSDVESL